MQNRNPIIFDVDGVLLSFLDTFQRFLLERHDFVIEGDPLPRPVLYSMTDIFPEGFKPLEYVKMMSTDPIFATMKPIAGADVALPLIAEHLDIHAITSAGCDKTKVLRHKNLQDVFGWKDSWDLHVLPLGSSKKDYFRLYPEGSVFVDDLLKNVHEARECGLDAIWFKGGEEHMLRDDFEVNAIDAGEPIVIGWDNLMPEIEKRYGLSFSAPEKKNDTRGLQFQM